MRIAQFDGMTSPIGINPMNVVYVTRTPSFSIACKDKLTPPEDTTSIYMVDGALIYVRQSFDVVLDCLSNALKED